MFSRLTLIFLVSIALIYTCSSAHLLKQSGNGDKDRCEAKCRDTSRQQVGFSLYRFCGINKIDCCIFDGSINPVPECDKGLFSENCPNGTHFKFRCN